MSEQIISQPELKTCPFCGGKPAITDLRLSWAVECEKCQATTFGDRAPEPDCEMGEHYWLKFYQSAIDNWNRRFY